MKPLFNVHLSYAVWEGGGGNKRCLTVSSFKPATHLAILYADRRDRRKSPDVPGAATAIFTDRRDLRIKSPISGMSSSCQISAIKFAGIRRVCPFPRFSTRIAVNRQSIRMGYFIRLLLKMVDSSDKMESENKREVPQRRDRRKNRQIASIGGENRLLFSLAIKFVAIGE